MRFRDRSDAGRKLASRLGGFLRRGEGIVLALPRGGVPVAKEIAHALNLPLDVFLVRKLGVPWHPELAMGAIATGVRVLNDEVIEKLGIAPSTIDAVAAAEERVLEGRSRLYRGNRPPPAVRGGSAILVDDGLATGSTMRAAVAALRKLGPARIIVAVPVAPASTCASLKGPADEVVCLSTIPDGMFSSVGAWYEDFAQTTDEEVIDLLREAARPAIVLAS